MSKKKEKIINPPPALPCTGVESHAHLNSKQFAEDLDEVVQKAKAAGVAQIGQVFLNPEAYYTDINRFEQFGCFFYILGIHPTEAFLYSPQCRTEMEKIIANDPQVKAVGEIGLDYYWKEIEPARQKEIFLAQLDMAKKCQLPVVVHSREATKDTLDILFAQGFEGYPLLWHCFGEDITLAKTIVQAGWHISIPGPVTYPKNTFLREAVASIPLERLLIETDCPYLSPEPLRGKRNEPANLGYTVQVMADARHMPVEELWTACGDNARRFFGLTG